mgnify:CR=1 FL=1
MSFVSIGSATSRIYRDTNLLTTTGTMTKMTCFKRTAATTGPQTLVALLGSVENHFVQVVRPEVDDIYAFLIAANNDDVVSTALGYLHLNAWVWSVVVGNGTDLTLALRPVGAAAWVSLTILQVAFAPTRISLAGDDSGTTNIPIKICDDREWDAVLNSTEWTTEYNNATHQRVTNVRSVKSGVGVDLTAALLGQVGATYIAGAGVTLDTDRPSFGPTILGIGQLPAGEEEVEMTLTTPAAPVVTVTNSDTVSVAVGSIDANADTVVIQAKKATDTTYSTVGTVAVGSLPAVITGLATGTAYNFRAIVTRQGANPSAASSVGNATTQTLYVDGYIKETLVAPGSTGVDVQIWRTAGPGHLVGEHLAYLTGQQFDVGLVNIFGDNHARIRVTLPNQPATGTKLRTNDTVTLVARKIISGNSYWSEIKTNATVLEA